MRQFLLTSILLLQLVSIFCDNRKIVCFYDGRSFLREGLGKVTLENIEPALAQCTHLVYGYAGIDGSTNKIKSLLPDVETNPTNGQFKLATGFKTKYPNLKVFLSLGGGADEGESEKYHKLIDSTTGRLAFSNSAISFLKNYGFDGLDLSFQFPTIRPKKIRSKLGSAWASFKKTIGVAQGPVDPDSENHKALYAAFVRELKDTFKSENLLLSVTVLPNVDPLLYLDVENIKPYVEFVILSAFDVQTPDRNPKEADYPAPIYPLDERDPRLNIDTQVTELQQKGLVPEKIVIGIASYGRAWKIERDATLSGFPPVQADGPYAAGPQTRKPGLFSYPEICLNITNLINPELKNEDVPFRSVRDPTNRMGTYAYRVANDEGNYGVWIGYEDPDSAGNKANYVKTKRLAGVAVFDLSLDDFRGACNGVKFPILTQIKQKLN
jgi:GH18 family chitinase